ncbi:MAG: mechanosensitive ion channel family protein [Haloplanus sp.]
MFDGFVSLLDSLPAWQATVLLLGLSFGSAVLVEVVGVRLAARLVLHTETAFDDVVVETLRLPVVVTVALAGVYALTRVPSVTANTLVDGETLSMFFGKPSLSIILLVWAWALNRVVNRLVETVKDRGDRFDFAPVFSNVWTLVVLLGAVAGLLSLWEYDISPLLAGAGIAGIAVGFAAKDTVANFFGGIALYFDDTYKLGDYVVLDTGESGTVVKVGVRSTTLLTRDEVLVTVPNSVLNATRVTNESAPGRRRRVRVPIGVAYGTDVDAFEELVVDLALAEPLVLDAPKPRMRFRRFGDWALEYELLCWVNGPTRASRTRHELNRAIYKALDAADVEIPYPRSDVSLRPPAGVSVATPDAGTDASSAETDGGRGGDAE